MTSLFISELWSKKVLFKFYDKTMFSASDIPIPEIDILRAILKRAAELKARHYPEAWIERDLQKLVEGLV